MGSGRAVPGGARVARLTVRLPYRLKVFLGLTALFAAASVAWSLVRWESHAPEREAWEAVTSTLGAGRLRIDALESAIDSLQAAVEADQGDLQTISRRIAHYESSARGGRLPTPQHRAYMTEIERHNRVVERHNRGIAELGELYAEYSGRVDTQNALIDSANAMQRQAAEEGYQLPEARLE